jgi:aconitate hydratase
MTRGTFANIRLQNQMLPGVEGGFTRFVPDGEQMTIYDASLRYKEEDIPLLVLAGKEYGTGSSRDWAAKGTLLLNVKAVIAQSFERIHRSNLVGMGVLPLQFLPGESVESFGLTGDESFDILGLDDQVEPQGKASVIAEKDTGGKIEFQVIVRLDTDLEIEYYRNGGILHKVLRDMLLD